MSISTIQDIQRHVQLGSTIIIICEGGIRIQGILAEINLEGIRIRDNNNKVSRIPASLITGYLQVDGGPSSAADHSYAQPSAPPPSANSHHDYEDSQYLSPPQESYADNLPDRHAAGSSNPRARQELEELKVLRPKIEYAEIKVAEPDFQEIHGVLSEERQLRDKIHRIRQSYENAKKTKELSSDFGRIAPLIQSLNSLLNEYETYADNIYPILGYFYFLERKFDKSQAACLRAYQLSGRKKDLISTIGASYHTEENLPLLYFVEKYFLTYQIDHPSLPLWYIFMRVSCKERHLKSIIDLLETKELSTTEEQTWYRQALIYFIMEMLGEAKALEALTRTLPESDFKASCQSLVEDYQLFKYNSTNYNSEKYNRDKAEQKLSAAANNVLPGEQYAGKESLPIGTTQRGRIVEYRGSYGWISTGKDEDRQYFHVTAITDNELKNLLREGKGMDKEVEFELGYGLQGRPATTNVRPIWTKKELFNLARKLYEEGETNYGLSYLNQLIKKDPNFPGAAQLQEQLKKSEIKRNKPKGNNPYDKAKRAYIDRKQPEKVIKLYLDAIEKNDKKEAAVKDLATYYNQLGQPENAIALLNRHSNDIRSRASIKRMLIPLYYRAGQFEPYINLLKEQATAASGEKAKANIWMLIGNGYSHLENWREAIHAYDAALNLDPKNSKAKFSLALAHSQAENYMRAKSYLEEILRDDPNIQAAQLEQQVTLALENSSHVDFNLVTSLASNNSHENISSFSRFLLDRIDLSLLVSRPGSLNPSGTYVEENEEYINFDLKQAVEFAKGQRTSRPKPRGDYYLMAARILRDLDKADDPRFPTYLGRALVSYGDDMVSPTFRPHALQQHHAEALFVYDKLEQPDQEQDARNALIRYLFSTLGSKDMIPEHRRKTNVSKALEELVSLNFNPQKFFVELIPLIVRSNFAQRRILEPLWKNHVCRNAFLSLLQDRYEIDPQSVGSPSEAIRQGWSRIAFDHSEANRRIDTAIAMLSEFENGQLWYKRRREAIQRVIDDQFLLETDRNVLKSINAILDKGIRYSEADVYSVQDTWLDEMIRDGQNLNEKILLVPTRIGIESVYPAIESLIEQLRLLRDQLYEQSLPEINLELKDENIHLEASKDGKTLDLDITINNRKGRSAAQEVLLTVVDPTSGKVLEDIFGLEGVLEGGEENYLRVNLLINPKLLERGAFSLNTSYTYRTVRGEEKGPFNESFPITLHREEEFEPIEDPYKIGGVVEKKMFYGRDELIEKIISELNNIRDKPQGDAYLLYGQKRTGKSSLLYYLNERLLKNDPDSGKNIVAYIKNAGSVLDSDSENLFPAFLWAILLQIRTGLRKFDKKISEDWKLPKRQKFLKDPDPLSLFNDLLSKYIELKEETPKLQDTQLVLLIDEFTYLYKEIKEGRLPENLMINFKAFLQENYFNSVLVGQDYALKFISQYKNAFAAIAKHRITYLSREEARRLIEEPIQRPDGESRYKEERAIEQILELTACSPFYIQIMCKRIVKFINDRQTPYITGAVVKRVTDLLTKDSNEFLGENEFESLYNSDDVSDDAVSPQDTLEVLYQIAKNSQRGSCWKGLITSNSTSHTVDSIIDRLDERDVIEPDKDRKDYYRIKVRLFQEWLIANYSTIRHGEE